MKKRDGDPWMPAGAYSKSLKGFGVNLLVQDVAASVAFATEVLEAVEALFASHREAMEALEDLVF